MLNRNLADGRLTFLPRFWYGFYTRTWTSTCGVEGSAFIKSPLNKKKWPVFRAGLEMNGHFATVHLFASIPTRPSRFSLAILLVTPQLRCLSIAGLRQKRK
jgi:hypothetical protein